METLHVPDDTVCRFCGGRPKYMLRPVDDNALQGKTSVLIPACFRCARLRGVKDKKEAGTKPEVIDVED